MKTKDLIEQLQAEDPSGEMEVCVDNVDIHFITTETSYWDGPSQILIRDSKLSPFYNIVGGTMNFEGSKIQIHTLTIKDAYIEAMLDGLPFELRNVGNHRGLLDRWQDEWDDEVIEVKEDLDEDTKEFLEKLRKKRKDSDYRMRKISEEKRKSIEQKS